MRQGLHIYLEFPSLLDAWQMPSANNSNYPGRPACTCRQAQLRRHLMMQGLHPARCSRWLLASRRSVPKLMRELPHTQLQSYSLSTGRDPRAKLLSSTSYVSDGHVSCRA